MVCSIVNYGCEIMKRYFDIIMNIAFVCVSLFLMWILAQVFGMNRPLGPSGIPMTLRRLQDNIILMNLVAVHCVRTY